MKESEAKKKWCPMVRLSINDQMSWDNRGNDLHDPNCIGSDCMMWETYWKHEDGDASNPMIPTDEGDCGLKSKELHCNF